MLEQQVTPPKLLSCIVLEKLVLIHRIRLDCLVANRQTRCGRDVVAVAVLENHKQDSTSNRVTVKEPNQVSVVVGCRAGRILYIGVDPLARAGLLWHGDLGLDRILGRSHFYTDDSGAKVLAFVVDREFWGVCSAYMVGSQILRLCHWGPSSGVWAYLNSIPSIKTSI